MKIVFEINSSQAISHLANVPKYRIQVRHLILILIMFFSNTKADYKNKLLFSFEEVILFF